MHSCVTLKKPKNKNKNKFPHYTLGIVMVFISLSDGNIKILEI